MGYRVWEWGVEIRLGSHCQRKESSSIIKRGFDSRADAVDWATSQDKSDWGVWDYCECGSSVVLDCPYEEIAFLVRGCTGITLPAKGVALWRFAVRNKADSPQEVRNAIILCCADRYRGDTEQHTTVVP